MVHMLKKNFYGLRDRFKSYIRNFSQRQSTDILPHDIFACNIEKFKWKMEFSIIISVHKADCKWLSKALSSIFNQTYFNWEVCIVDDASNDKGLIDYLKSIDHPNVKIKYNIENYGCSTTATAAVAMATGDFIIFMDNDGELREEALYYIAETLNEKPTAGILYADEDKITTEGVRKDPFCKPDWSPDLLQAQMYMGSLLIIKKELFDMVGGFRGEFEGSQAYDLMLRLSLVTDQIVHIPKILYSRRQLDTPMTLDPGTKSHAHRAGLKALDRYLKIKYGETAYAEESKYLFVYDARFKIDTSKMKVSIIIPMRDHVELTKACVESILDTTTYANFEIVILNNRSQERKTFEWFNKIHSMHSNIKIVAADYEFNWSKLNNQGIREADGDVFIFMNNDVVAIHEDWMERLVENAVRKDIGIVGALLLYEDNTIQHAGVVVGMSGWADHVFKNMAQAHLESPYVSPVVNRNVLACTGACIAISRVTIEKIGYFDERFIICGSDVEIGLRAYRKGLRNLYNARVRLYHLESKSRDSHVPKIDFTMSENAYREFLILGDPYWNRNLDLQCLNPTYKGQ